MQTLTHERPPPTSPYRLHVGKRELQPFADYLARAIDAGGYPTPTHFARAAGIDPSVVSRWLDAVTRPSIALLERAAPALDVDVDQLIALVYPSASSRRGAPQPPPPPVPEIHPLVRDLARLLPADAAESLLPEDERHLLETLIGRVIEPYRRRLRRRRAG